MKSTGIVRNLDNLGRIVIPVEVRKILNISEKDPVEIYINGESIVLKKYAPACIFCGEADDIVNYKGRNICKSCIKVLKRKLD